MENNNPIEEKSKDDIKSESCNLVIYSGEVSKVLKLEIDTE